MSRDLHVQASPRIGSVNRNSFVDWARAVSVCVVVVFHTRLFAVVLVDGNLELTMWDPAPVWWLISWPLMAIPVFFVAGGYGHAVSLTKGARNDIGYGAFLVARGRRLLGPTTVFVCITSALASGASLLGDPIQIGAVTASGMSLLWFITTYLGITVVAPAMVTMHRRLPVATLAALAGAAVVIDAAAHSTGIGELRLLNLAPVWLFAHQLGIAYHGGWFRTWSRRNLTIIMTTCGVLIAVLVGVFGYPPVSVGIGSIPIANVLPPTFAMVPLAVAQTCLLALFEQSAPAWAQSRRGRSLVDAVNALLMTIYLWHVPCIIAANAVWWLSGVGRLCPPLVDHVAISALSIGLVAVASPLVGRLDAAMVPRLGANQSTAWAVAAMLTAVASVALVWRCGVVVNLTQMWSSLGVLGVVSSWVMMRHAARAGIG